MSKKFNEKMIREGVRMILKGLGEDIEREGLQDTPYRVSEMFKEIFGGIHQDPSVYLKTFTEPGHEEMVMVKDIPLYSMCEHHMLPFAGYAHVAYIPKKGKIVGLSKIARVVDAFSKRLQLQERLTTQIADTLYENLQPYGVMVVIEAEHMCMTMRGIKKPKSLTVTSALRGIFRNDIKAREEALSLIKSTLRRG
jgi:GTP cyclohydrolase I